MSREALGNFELMVLLAVLRVGEDAYGVPIAHELEDTTGRGTDCGLAPVLLRHLSRTSVSRAVRVGACAPRVNSERPCRHSHHDVIRELVVYCSIF
jgi:PadR family transcriptional regulator, regulatory protein PadR